MRVKLTYGGESHGYGLAGLLEGIPQGMEVDLNQVKLNLARRKMGAGRGERSNFEFDNFTIICGVMIGETTGGPIGFMIKNASRELRHQRIPRPGHVDLAGALKYGTHDIDVAAERGSARETAIRVLGGTLCIQLLEHFNIKITGWVESIGSISTDFEVTEDFETITELIKKTPVACPDMVAAQMMTNELKIAADSNDTLGGTVRVAVKGVVPGIGGIGDPDKRLDALLAAALMSIPSVKGVEIGKGFSQAKMRGSQAHDPIFWGGAGYYHEGNLAGGIEGGLSNGEMIMLRAALKPIPTLKNGLPSVNLETKQSAPGPFYRSDTCAVPSSVVIAEAMTALVLADAYMEKFGGDSLNETLRNFDAYKDAMKRL